MTTRVALSYRRAPLPTCSLSFVVEQASRPVLSRYCRRTGLPACSLSVFVIRASYDILPRKPEKKMRLTSTLLFLLATAYGQTKPPLVDFEMMTWPEVKQALDHGKTTALIYNGGTEPR